MEFQEIQKGKKNKTKFKVYFLLKGGKKTHLKGYCRPHLECRDFWQLLVAPKIC